MLEEKEVVKFTRNHDSARITIDAVVGGDYLRIFDCDAGTT